jgi:hypothetical protein
MAFPLGPPDLPFGSPPEVALESLIGVDPQEPVGVMSPGRLDQSAVVAAILNLLLGSGGDHEKIHQEGLGFDERPGFVGRLIVTGDDAVDLACQILEQTRQEPHLVAEWDKRQEAPAPAATKSR